MKKLTDIRKDKASPICPMSIPFFFSAIIIKMKASNVKMASIITTFMTLMNR